MLSLNSVSASVMAKGEEVSLLEDITATFLPGQFVAIVGPSGCGKTSLIKTIAGLLETTEGSIYWKEKDLEEEDFQASELGYVPQFSIACEDLTVMENVRYAADLRVRVDSEEEMQRYLDKILEETGLSERADHPVKVLSGGQKRRLSLAIELTADPALLLCDEVTSGLDLHSENQIVRLLKNLAHDSGRLVLSVTHSLENLHDYDSVVVLYDGVLAYHGPPDQVIQYFKAKNASGIFHQLPQLSPEKWKASWQELKKSYPIKRKERKKVLKDPEEKQPGMITQARILLQRRWAIFFRDKTQSLMNLALLIGFPLIVVLFSERGREPIRKLSDAKEENLFLEIANQAAVHQDQLTVGSAVSGIVMFQVVLLCLMGSNNSSREIAGERQIWEKERLAGVSPVAYLMSKLVFLGSLVFIQSSVMAFLVEVFWQFRGDLMAHWFSLLLVNAAMTAICLAVSSFFKNPAPASLLSIYLVGFQLPLSGAILTLPQLPEAVTRPFISAYWAWSGSMESLQSNIYTAVKTVSGTSLSDATSCFLILGAHIILGIIFSIIGINRSFSD